ncbi:hypothetical protein K501DRAFT_159013, partial [Backusella circina FSU 941]
MFIGDRGHGVGSSIKRHLRYGGKWKEMKHSRYTQVIITNGHNTSQNCPYCFQKLDHPYKRVTKNGKETLKAVPGSSECTNQHCIINLTKRACMARDKVSFLLIGLSGLSRVAFGVPFPQLN